MKRAGAANGSNGDGNLVVYSNPGFAGESKKFTENDPSLKGSWGNKPIKSMIIEGNPWCFFPEDNMKGIPFFFEAGKYHDLGEVSFPETVASLKYIEVDMGTPELVLASSTTYKSEAAPWVKADFSVELLKYVSAGPGGIFGIKAKDESVWFRTYEQGGKPSGKVAFDTDQGAMWNKIQGGLRQLSVGTNCLWGVNAEGRVVVRLGISPDNPSGREWVTVDAEPMKQISVSTQGHVWGIDNREKIWYRKGACLETPLGQNWKSISGNLKQISVGQCGVWGINSEQCVYFRLNTYGDPDAEGTGWMKVEGKFQHIYSGSDCVIALAGNRDIYFRANVFEKDGNAFACGANHEGTHWARIEQSKESKIIFKQVECTPNTMWGVDKDNCVWFKKDGKIDKFCEPHYTITLYGDQPEFSMYNFPSRASTYKAITGGWALYTEPNFQGKIMFHFGNDCLSNDPPNKDSPYKSFFTQIGSARPIRGKNFKTPIVSLTMDWLNMKSIIEKKVLFSQELQNASEEYMDAPWAITFDAEATVSHRFELSKPSGTVIKGCEFSVEPVEPLRIHMDDDPDVFTGDEFHAQLASYFTFKDELHASRQAKKTQIIKLPPLIPPRCTFKVEICMYKGKFRVPFQAEFKYGFPLNFNTGSDSWQESGFWQGDDESNIKLEISCVKMPPTRKVSKMLNGLGGDM